VNDLTQRTGVATSGSAFTTAASAGTTAWAYDALGQVVSADAPATAKDFGYRYDFMGNRQKSSRNSTDPGLVTFPDLARYRPDTGTAPTGPFGGTALNQYVRLELYGATAINNTYDVDGNQINGRYADTNRTPGTRSWDGENRLITAVVNLGYPNTTVSTYDAYHRRVAKRVGQLQQNSTTTYTTSYTLYDGWNPVSEYQTPSAAAPTLLNSYTWGTDLSGTFQGAGGVGGLLSVKQYPSGSVYYPTFDGNGNVSEYLNSAGSTIAHYEYGPFGEHTFITPGTLPSSFRHRFSTKPLDAETGYYYYGYRSYDPLSGRWINRDPIGEGGGINLYGFCASNSINSVDFLGMLTCPQPTDADKKKAAADADTEASKKHSGTGSALVVSWTKIFLYANCADPSFEVSRPCGKKKPCTCQLKSTITCTVAYAVKRQLGWKPPAIPVLPGSLDPGGISIPAGYDKKEFEETFTSGFTKTCK
jgi:RHS repeat-associated protein